MHIIWTLVIGLVIGALAKLIHPGKDPGGILITMVIGVAGSLLASLVGHAAGWYRPDEGAGFLASVVGAVVLLVAYHAIQSRRGQPV